MISNDQINLWDEYNSSDNSIQLNNINTFLKNTKIMGLKMHTWHLMIDYIYCALFYYTIYDHIQISYESI